EGPRLEEPPWRGFGVERGDALAGQAHELPAPAAGSTGYDRRRARRIAQLPVGRVPHAPRARDDVDDQPVEEEAEIGDGGAEVPADETVGPVAADDPSGPDAVPMSVAPRHDQLDALAGQPQVDDLAGPSKLHAGKTPRAGIEHALELGLPEHVGLGPAREACVPASDAKKRLARGVSPLVDVGRLGPPGQLLPQPGGLQDAGDLVVEVDRARQR